MTSPNNTVAGLAEKLRFMVANGRKMGVNEDTLDVIEIAAEVLESAPHQHLRGAHLSGKVEGCLLCDAMAERDSLEAALASPTPSAPDRMAIKLLVAAGFITEAKANEALNIAHGFSKEPLSPPSAPVVDDAMAGLLDAARREFRDSDAAGDVLDWLTERAALSGVSANVGVEGLRAEQAAAVMPLIGPLLDAWDRVHPDDTVQDSGIGRYIEPINRAMEGDAALTHPAAAPRVETSFPTVPSMPGNWPEDASHENGDYECECSRCGATFYGHKRRVVCKVCATPAASDEGEQA